MVRGSAYAPSDERELLREMVEAGRRGNGRQNSLRRSPGARPKWKTDVSDGLRDPETVQRLDNVAT